MQQGTSLLPDSQDRAFSVVLELFAPSGLKGVILAGFFVSVMSTVSALSNSIATIFSLDVYKKFIHKNARDRELIITGQVSGGAALLISSLVAPLVGNIGLFKYFQTGVTYMATPFISVLLMDIFWRRTSYAGAIAGLMGGVFIQIALAVSLLTADIHLHWLYVGAIAQVLTMLLIMVVSLNTAPPRNEQVKPFLWRMSWISTLEVGAKKRPCWQSIKLWLVLYAIVWCYIYWRFW
ncbi:sodium:solute symporter family transporter [Agriterribacter sp.]|uniref:sodium:solute symporter family transporter n=1 Tax=Agriterribacter sp. TaxID=2821509 RepID=UPI002C23862B|nr:hypothetical protein [Agriterribacter sp.]HTN07347.1 hypothetical protein [Agriterribacter sp.]